MQALAAADAMEALTEAVDENFGGDWRRAMREMGRMYFEGSGRIRLQAREAQQRIYIVPPSLTPR